MCGDISGNDNASCSGLLHAEAMHCPVVWVGYGDDGGQCMVCAAIGLRARYAMPGTDIAVCAGLEGFTKGKGLLRTRRAEPHQEYEVLNQRVLVPGGRKFVGVVAFV
eukprot:1353741-Rhodomonas_salina.1